MEWNWRWGTEIKYLRFKTSINKVPPGVTLNLHNDKRLRPMYTPIHGFSDIKPLPQWHMKQILCFRITRQNIEQEGSLLLLRGSKTIYSQGASSLSATPFSTRVRSTTIDYMYSHENQRFRIKVRLWLVRAGHDDKNPANRIRWMSGGYSGRDELIEFSLGDDSKATGQCDKALSAEFFALSKQYETSGRERV